SLPKAADPEQVTLETAVELLRSQAEKKKTQSKKGAGAKKATATKKAGGTKKDAGRSGGGKSAAKSRAG
ncbi:topoisomerase C-terminal repeat-containing protein, partial [Halomonas sp. SIMBA_159]